MSAEMSYVEIPSFSNGACVTHLLSGNVIVLTGTTCFHSNTIIPSGVELSIEGTGEFHIIGTGG